MKSRSKLVTHDRVVCVCVDGRRSRQQRLRVVPREAELEEVNIVVGWRRSRRVKRPPMSRDKEVEDAKANEQEEEEEVDGSEKKQDFRHQNSPASLARSPSADAVSTLASADATSGFAIVAAAANCCRRLSRLLSPSVGVVVVVVGES